MLYTFNIVVVIAEQWAEYTHGTVFSISSYMSNHRFFSIFFLNVILSAEKYAHYPSLLRLLPFLSLFLVVATTGMVVSRKENI